MSNPTTPFGWQMPQNTDLVTDLPADFEVFGQAVATSMQDLLGGTTGQILSKTSNTDMDFTWTTSSPGDITGVTAGTGISGGGTSGDVTVTNSMATAFTTSGDLIQATGSGTFARLGTGTNGQYLTTNGTTNSWGTVSAGGMTVLASGSLSGSNVSLTSISTSYNDLRLVIKNYIPATDNQEFALRVNNLATSSYLGMINPGASLNTSFGSTEVYGVQNDNAVSQSCIIWDFPEYANTTTWKLIDLFNIANNATTTTNANIASRITAVNTTSAITRIDVFPYTGNFTSGTYILYGVK